LDVSRRGTILTGRETNGEETPFSRKVALDSLGLDRKERAYEKEREGGLGEEKRGLSQRQHVI